MKNVFYLKNDIRCDKMTLTNQLMEKLKYKSRKDQLEGMARYGIKTDMRLGVSIPDIRKIAKDFGRNHKVALELWKTGYADAKITAALIDEPDKVTENQMEEWVKEIDSWDVCDQICIDGVLQINTAHQGSTAFRDNPNPFFRCENAFINIDRNKCL